MNEILIFYIIGVIVCLTMVGKSALSTPIKTWELKSVLRMVSFVLLSWLFVAFFAIRSAWEE